MRPVGRRAGHHRWAARWLQTCCDARARIQGSRAAGQQKTSAGRVYVVTVGHDAEALSASQQIARLHPSRAQLPGKSSPQASFPNSRATSFTAVRHMPGRKHAPLRQTCFAGCVSGAGLVSVHRLSLTAALDSFGPPNDAKRDFGQLVRSWSYAYRILWWLRGMLGSFGKPLRGLSDGMEGSAGSITYRLASVLSLGGCWRYLSIVNR